jgi:alanine-glyoxylate transaminase / serine-glyoxylate transaminase / serine-pyruvate transaminase
VAFLLCPRYLFSSQETPMSTSRSGHPTGRHFLQIPGPTNVPDRVLRPIEAPTIDHRGPDFGRLGKRLLANLRTIFKTTGPVVIYPASGTGAWEAALVNTLSPGDAVLMCQTGWFATLWREMAELLGLIHAGGMPPFVTDAVKKLRAWEKDF